MTAALAPVVVGVDGSMSALDAASWAGSLAAAIGAPLQVVYAMPYRDRHATDATAVLGSVALGQRCEAAEMILGSIEHEVRQKYPALVVTASASCDPIDDALVTASETARLVVIACDDVNVAGALLVGSATLDVIDRAACPVVAWRGDGTHVTAKPIVVGVDRSAAAHAALATAFDLADELGAPLRAIHGWPGWQLQDDMALPHLIDIACAPVDDTTAWEATQWRLLNAVVDPWRERHPRVNVTLLGLPAKPQRALIEHVSDAQMIVTGSRRRKALSRGVFGSTSLAMLHHAKVPVVVCPMSS